MAELFVNFVAGLIDNSPLLIGGLTLNSTGLASLPTVAAPDTMWIVLDPDASAGAPEIVQVTTHTAAAITAAIARGQQGTVARQHLVNVPWRTALTKSDADKLPVRVLTTTGDLLIASAANTPARLAGAAGVLHGAVGAAPSYSKIVAADITAATITAAQIAPITITAAELATDAVTTTKITNNHVTAGKLATDAVTNTKIANGAVTDAKMAAPTRGRWTVTAESITTSTVESLSPDAEVEDTASIWTSGVNFTIPSTGTYAFSIRARRTAGNMGADYLQVDIDGTEYTSPCMATAESAATFVVYAAASDLVQFSIWNGGATTTYSAVLQITKVTPS